MTARISRTRVALAATLCALTLGAAQPAVAATVAPEPATTAPAPAPKPAVFGSKLTLVKYKGEYRGIPSKASFALLTCNPPGGTHPMPRAACGLLREVNGNIHKLNKHPDRMCTKQYDPVTVESYGRWNGRYVHQWKTFGNACEAAAATGAVYAF